jgi:tetratricopeptide (TPR) repeat protein
MGFQQAEGQHWNDALHEYEEAWRLGYKGADLLGDWGIAYLNLSQPERGLEKFQQAVQVENGASEWVNMGDAYAAMQRYPEALDAFEKAQKIDATFTYIYLERGKVHLSTQECAAAVKDFNDTLSTALPGESAYEYAKQFMSRAQACAGTH